MGTLEDSSLSGLDKGLSCTFLAGSLACTCCTNENAGSTRRCKGDELLLFGIVGD